MKRIFRLNEDDLREVLAAYYDVPEGNVTIIINEEPHGPIEELTPEVFAEIELMKGEIFRDERN